MQTKLAFLFVLHVIALGFFLARGEARMRPRNLAFVFAYLFAFYALWGTAMNAIPGLYVPTATGGAPAAE